MGATLGVGVGDAAGLGFGVGVGAGVDVGFGAGVGVGVDVGEADTVALDTGAGDDVALGIGTAASPRIGATGVPDPVQAAGSAATAQMASAHRPCLERKDKDIESPFFRAQRIAKAMASRRYNVDAVHHPTNS